MNGNIVERSLLEFIIESDIVCKPQHHNFFSAYESGIYNITEKESFKKFEREEEKSQNKQVRHFEFMTQER